MVEQIVRFELRKDLGIELGSENLFVVVESRSVRMVAAAAAGTESCYQAVDIPAVVVVLAVWTLVADFAQLTRRSQSNQDQGPLRAALQPYLTRQLVPEMKKSQLVSKQSLTVTCLQKLSKHYYFHLFLSCHPVQPDTAAC